MEGAARFRAATTVSSFSPGDVEHCLGQEDDQHHMAENADVDELEVPGFKLSACTKRDRCYEMRQHADRKRDLDREQRCEAAVERVAQGIAILPRHGDAGSIKYRHNERHQAPGAATNSCLDRPHHLPAERFAGALEDQDFEEYSADKHDSGKKM